MGLIVMDGRRECVCGVGVGVGGPFGGRSGFEKGSCFLGYIHTLSLCPKLGRCFQTLSVFL